MTCIRPFQATDIFNFNSVNVDAWTATYSTSYYLNYLSQWPDFCFAAEGAFERGKVQAYMIAKHEPPPPDTQHHGHLTALSVAPAMRGTGLASVFMAILERLSSDGTAGYARDLTGGARKGQTDGISPDADLNGVASDENVDNVDCVDAYFVDLFVRCNNHLAIEMYEKLGYSVYRRVVDYYHGMEGVGSSRDELDGFDMRKSMPRDKENRYTRPNGRNILVTPDQVWS